MSEEHFGWFLRFRIECRIFFDNDKLGLTFYTKKERDDYKNGSLWKKFLIRRNFAIEKTRFLEKLYLDEKKKFNKKYSFTKYNCKK